VTRRDARRKKKSIETEKFCEPSWRLSTFPSAGRDKSEWWMKGVGRMAWGATFSREGKTRDHEGYALVVVVVVV